MTKRQRPPPISRTAAPQQSAFDIAVNMLLRCEHLLRSLAFQCPREGEESIKETRKLCNDFHETLFIIDHALHKYRNEHNKASGQGGKHLQEEGDHRRHHYHHDTDDAYRLLSEINEQLTDYAFLIGHKIHPWDIPYVFEQSTNSASTDAPGAPQIQFPPATWKNRTWKNRTWKNRVLRQATTPLAGFPLENSAHSEDKLT